MRNSFILALAGLITTCSLLQSAQAKPKMCLIRPSADGTHFVCADSNSPFIVWGVQYEHDDGGRITGEQWKKHLPEVAEDFKIIKAHGANIIRLHFATNKLLPTPTEPNPQAIDEMKQLLKLAEETGLYLDITGLACYYKQDVPPWYAQADEKLRWEVQARFWETMAEVCKDSDAIFCYDLMNEPMVTGPKEKGYLGFEEFAGRTFLQALTLEPGDRKPEQIAKAWVDKLTAAIRKHDKKHMITVGEIPWSQVWPGAKSPFYHTTAAANLDYVSIHVYPESGKIDKAINAIKSYPAGKPIVIEETFPISCSMPEWENFFYQSKPLANGWISAYWRHNSGYDYLMKIWLENFPRITYQGFDQNTLWCK